MVWLGIAVVAIVWTRLRWPPLTDENCGNTKEQVGAPPLRTPTVSHPAPMPFVPAMPYKVSALCTRAPRPGSSVLSPPYVEALLVADVPNQMAVKHIRMAPTTQHSFVGWPCPPRGRYQLTSWNDGLARNRRVPQSTLRMVCSCRMVKHSSSDTSRPEITNPPSDRRRATSEFHRVAR